MKFQEKIFKIFRGLHVSEKSSMTSQKNNTFVIKVLKNSTKNEIKISVEKFFKVIVLNVNTLIVKGKRKNNKKGNVNKYSFKKNWKKAYVTLKKGHSLNF
ncbi:50S ribosomal protein L23 [Buchnera aphidicola (Ceratoglyphina bambusae)]|uniref:50S ribosomal protein L23 n=1 Tax=Buchnera aphidicola TaxID=9 RepID=UPI0031B88008